MTIPLLVATSAAALSTPIIVDVKLCTRMSEAKGMV